MYIFKERAITSPIYLQSNLFTPRITFPPFAWPSPKDLEEATHTILTLKTSNHFGFSLVCSLQGSGFLFEKEKMGLPLSFSSGQSFSERLLSGGRLMKGF
jgi:hypothetical protein